MKSVQDVVDTNAAVSDCRLSEIDLRIDDHVNPAVRRKVDQADPVAVILDMGQIIANDVGEDTLLVADDDEVIQGIGRLGIGAASPAEVVENLRAIGLEAIAREGGRQTDVLIKPLDRRPDPLHGHSGRTDGTENEGFGKPDKGHCSAATSAGFCRGDQRRSAAPAGEGLVHIATCPVRRPALYHGENG